MGNARSTSKKSIPSHAFNGDITRQDVVENTASVLEHLVCAPVSVTFKAIHCNEPEHEERKCGIHIAGRIFKTTVCKKLSNLLIFGTNFTSCPPSSINLFFEGVANIPKLESIELIGCTFTKPTLQALFASLTARPKFAHLLFRNCTGLDVIDTPFSRVLSDPTQLSLDQISLLSCDISAEGLRYLGTAIADNPHPCSITFKYAPQEGPMSDDALISAFTHILPLVESFHLQGCEAVNSERVAESLISVIKETNFPKNFKLDLCSLGFATATYQEILNTIAESSITRLQLSLPKAGVDTEAFDNPLQTIMNCKNIAWLSLHLYEPGNFSVPLPQHTAVAIAASLKSPSCKLRAARFPAMGEDGNAELLSALACNKSLQQLAIGHLLSTTFLQELTNILSTKQNLSLYRFSPIFHGFEALFNGLRRNETYHFYKKASLSQLCFVKIEQNAEAKRKAWSILDKDLLAKMNQFITWKATREKANGSIAGNYWENPNDSEWYLPP